MKPQSLPAPAPASSSASEPRVAGRSTGPTSDEGKKRSRLNAFKHGLSGGAMSFADRHQESFAQRLDAWRNAFDLRDAFDDWNYRELVAESLRIEHCRASEISIASRLAGRAEATWDQLREIEARELAGTLDENPEVVAARLRATKHGCAVLAEKWEALTRVLQEEGDWNDEQKSLALDLLGVDPRLRSCHHLFKIGAPDADQSLLNSREAFALAQAAELREIIATRLDIIDEVDRDLASAGIFIHEPKEIAVIRRYEKECMRRYERLFKRLRLATDAAELETEPASATEVDAETASPRNREKRRVSKKPSLKKRKPSSTLDALRREFEAASASTKPESPSIPDLATSDVSSPPPPLPADFLAWHREVIEGYDEFEDEFPGIAGELDVPTFAKR